MNNIAHIPKAEIEHFCRKWGVVELSVFGSALRDDFSPESDIDVLITLAPKARVGMFDMVRMERELQELLGRHVDLIERRSVEMSENYIRREAILASAEVIYAAG